MPNYKDQNSKWTEKKEKPPMKYRFPNHPWSHTNRFIKSHHDRIWTDDVTPENGRVEKYK